MTLNIVISRVKAVSVEVAPMNKKEHLNDRTLIDVVVDLEVGPGESSSISFEVKLLDRYVSRVLTFGDAYRRLIESTGVWIDGVETKVGREINQLFRVHALSISRQMKLESGKPPVLVLLHHPLDKRALDVVRSYRLLLADKDSIHILSADTLIQAMKLTAPDQESQKLVDLLESRYLDLDPTGELWSSWAAGRRRDFSMDAAEPRVEIKTSATLGMGS